MKIRKQYILRYWMLAASIWMLLSVIVPHHHHADGMPCCFPMTEQGMDPDDEEADHADAHDCNCEGHNLAILSGSSTLLHGSDMQVFWVPLQTLFDYLDPTLALSPRAQFGEEEAVFIESLHGVWVASAAGLRAPPAGSFCSVSEI